MKLVLWDKAEKCNFSDNRILYWNDYSFSEKPLSELNTNLENDNINNYLENHSEDIRDDFLDWVNKLSSVKINNKKFKDLIKLENNFSYWNLCEFNELSNFSKSKKPVLFKFKSISVSSPIVSVKLVYTIFFLDFSIKLNKSLNRFLTCSNIPTVTSFHHSSF